MPHRKLVQIGRAANAPALPTVAEYFRALADRQGEDIARLKEQAAERAKVRPKVATRKQAKKTVLADGWRLHPTTDQVAAAPARGQAKKKSKSKSRATMELPTRALSQKGTPAGRSRRKSGRS